MSDTTENSAADSAGTEEKAPRRRAPRRATTTEPLATAEAVTASATVTGSESNRSSDASEPTVAPRRGRGKKLTASERCPLVTPSENHRGEAGDQRTGPGGSPPGPNVLTMMMASSPSS